MAYTTGGSFSPVTLEPSTAETQLAAEIAKQNPATAPGLLNLYQERQKAAAGTYTDQFNQARLIQLQNLQQQMIDNAVKAMDVSAKNPATFDLIAHAPGFQSLLGGASPDTINRVGTALANQGLLNQYDTIGKAATGMAGGGITPPIGVFSNIVGTNLQPQTPTSTTNTIIGGQYHLAGQQAAAGMMEVPMNIGERDAFGNPIKTQVKVPIFATPEQRQPYIDAARSTIAQSVAGQPNVGGGIPDSRTAQSTPGTAPGGAPGGPSGQQGFDASGHRQTSNPNYDATGTSDQSGNPLLGPLPGAPAIPTNLGQAPPAQAPAAPATTNTSAAPQRSAPTGGAQAAPAPPKPLPDTTPGRIEDHSTPYGIQLQNRAIQGLRTLPQAAQAEVLWERMHGGQGGVGGNIIPIRRIGGIEYYIDRNGNKLGPVP